MKTVLYSCIGTTDPVRGLRDGGLMHIMRFYRPDIVYLFLTSEILRLDKKDNRIAKTFSHIKENWDGYVPQVIRYETDIEDPSDMDILTEPMNKLFQRVLRENPGDQILLNLSSGTPQMQILLVQMALDPRYSTRGVQVKKPEKRSGTAARTSEDPYPVDEALLLNEDDEADPPNRCCEPKMMAVRREAVRNQLVALVSQRNYAAISQMGAQLPAPIPKLAKHLDYRSHFLLSEAQKAASGLTGLGLFADQGKMSYAIYEMVEYFGVLRHLVYLKRYTDFVLRLNPFLVRLQLTMLEEKLKKIHVQTEKVIVKDGSHIKINANGMQEKLPEMCAFLEDKMHSKVQDRDVSISALNGMLEYLNIDKDPLALLIDCEKLNSRLRNTAAHNLFSISDESIRAICNRSAEDIVKALEKTLLHVLEQYDQKELKKRLTVYERCDAYILKCL